MGITNTADGGLFLLQEAYARDLLERFKNHVPATANSVELRAELQIRLNTNGFKKLKGYQGERLEEHESLKGAKECKGNFPYKKSPYVTHGKLVGTQEDPSVSKWDDDLWYTLPAPNIQRPSD